MNDNAFRSRCPKSGKFCYESKSAAKRAKDRLVKYNMQHGGRIDRGLRCFPCSWCKGWHLGHRTNKKPKHLRE